MKRFKLISVVAFVLAISMVFSMIGSAITVPGDYDKSKKVTASDAIYLLKNTLFGDEEYPLYYAGDLNNDGIIDSDDAVYMLYSSIFGTEDYPIPEVDETGRIPIYFNKNGKVNAYDLRPGDAVPEGNDYITEGFVRYKFLGWYDASLTTEYKTIPDHIVTMYAKYEGYTAYTYDFGGIYDPNDRNMIEIVKDPFGGIGNVLHTVVINNTSEEYNGTFRGLSPSLYDNKTGEGFKVENGHRYQISFKYRYSEGAPASASCSLSAFVVSAEGIHMTPNSSNRKQLSASYSVGNGSLTNKGDWTESKFTVNVNSEFEYLYFRFLGSSRTEAYDFYIDDLAIVDITDENNVKLVNNGVTEKTDLKVGDTLPTMDNIFDDLSEVYFEFDGWYDSTLTTKYTTVVDGVGVYYAKYKNYTGYSFETDGIYNPKGKYSATSQHGAAWWRELDPTGDDNICLRVDLSNNASNTNVCLQQLEGSSDGFKLTAGSKYLISYRYYVDTVETKGFPSFQIRGSTYAGIGASGGKTDSFAGGEYEAFGRWVNTAYIFTATSSVNTSPYLILLAQRTGSPYTKVYIDDLYICEFDADDDIKLATPAYDITVNDHGDAYTISRTSVGVKIENPRDYYGATFKGWYNEEGTVPYPTVSESNISVYAKHDGSILNFENGGYYDPNKKFGNVAISPHSIVTDPTNSKNKVLKTTIIKNNGNNTHFALNASGYSEAGYKLTVGNTYEISFMYYIENLKKGSVGLQFRGCKKENIGISGGKSESCANGGLSEVNSWTGVTYKFTYTGKGLEGEESPYLLMLLQYTAGDVNVYIDDIVIKETVPEKTYVKKAVKIGGWTIGYQPRPHNIVIPTYNFSYLARMQCEELEKFIENTVTTGCDVKIVTEENWKEADNQFNIFVGDVKGHSRDNQFKVDTSKFTKDDYGMGFGGGNVYIDGGSTYALAMGISEFIKMLEAAADGSTISGRVSGKYSEKIGSYSTATYYRPTFLEDFEGAEIDTSIWNIIDGSAISARDFVDENGNVIKAADTVDANGEVIKGHGWQSIRSPEHTYLDGNGNLIIEGAYSKEKKTFYGGMLKSHGNLEYRYGYYEVSCITPDGKGIWTANWLTPHGYTDGLYSSEIDVNESFGNAKASNFNMHSWPRAAATNLGLPKYSLDGVSGCSAKNATLKVGKGFADGFHTFGYMWDENSAKFIVDGRVQFSYNYDDKHTVSGVDSETLRTNDYDTFREKLSIIVSMTTANPASGSNPVLGADYWNTTNKYIVDYVHIYQIDGQEIYFPGRDAAEAE